jgi:tartrate dehydratase beta subunit/fumarate hydratase class I family protein
MVLLMNDKQGYIFTGKDRYQMQIYELLKALEDKKTGEIKHGSPVYRNGESVLSEKELLHSILSPLIRFMSGKGNTSQLTNEDLNKFQPVFQVLFQNCADREYQMNMLTKGAYFRELDRLVLRKNEKRCRPLKEVLDDLGIRYSNFMTLYNRKKESNPKDMQRYSEMFYDLRTESISQKIGVDEWILCRYYLETMRKQKRTEQVWKNVEKMNCLLFLEGLGFSKADGNELLFKER